MILITGASSGIGQACAEALAQAGKDLFLVARRLDRLKTLATKLKRQKKIRCEVARVDVSDLKSVQRFVQAQGKSLKNISVLINCAGLARGLDPIQSGNIEDWDEMINTNLRGLLYITRQILPKMLEKKSGHIINIGSVAGRWVYPKGNVYCATKHAVSALTEALRIDLAGSGIRVTEVSPGMVETGFSQVRLRDSSQAKTVYAGMTPLNAHDVADTIVWCLSRPAHVNIQEVVLYPTDQASPTVVTRRSERA